LIEENQHQKGSCGCSCRKSPKQPAGEYRKEDYDGCWQGTDEGEEE